MKTYDIKAITYPSSDEIIGHTFVASDCRPTGIFMEDGNSGFSTIPVVADGKLALWLSVALQDVENSRQFTFKLDNGDRTCFQSEGGVLLDESRLRKLKDTIDRTLAVLDSEEDHQRHVNRAIDVDDERVGRSLRFDLQEALRHGPSRFR